MVEATPMGTSRMPVSSVTYSPSPGRYILTIESAAPIACTTKTTPATVPRRLTIIVRKRGPAISMAAATAIETDAAMRTGGSHCVCRTALMLSGRLRLKFTKSAV
jgi:hypothetical protein